MFWQHLRSYIFSTGGSPGSPSLASEMRVYHRPTFFAVFSATTPRAQIAAISAIHSSSGCRSATASAPPPEHGSSGSTPPAQLRRQRIRQRHKQPRIVVLRRSQPGIAIEQSQARSTGDCGASKHIFRCRISSRTAAIGSGWSSSFSISIQTWAGCCKLAPRIAGTDSCSVRSCARPRWSGPAEWFRSRSQAAARPSPLELSGSDIALTLTSRLKLPQ